MATVRCNDVMDVIQIGEAFGWGSVTCDQLGTHDGDADIFEPVRIDVTGRYRICAAHH